jgi:hypothetical protein
MGLDPIELIMDVEEAFDLTIPDQEAEKMVTVGHMYRYVLARLEERGTVWRSSGRCPSQIAFHQFRRILVEGMEIERGAVRLATPLGQIVGVEGRSEAWDRLGRAVGGSWPRLVRPDWLIRRIGSVLIALFIVSVVITFIGGLVANAETGTIVLAGFVVPTLIVIGFDVLAWRLTAPLATEIPRDCSTVRDCVSLLLQSQSNAILGDPSVRYGPAELWAMIQRIVSTQLGVPLNEVTESATWVDLGIS